MAKRETLEKSPIIKPKTRLTINQEELVGLYYKKDRPIDFIHSGSTLLDCVLGGGWPLGRVCNIVGDKSTGKTLLAIEACANFKHQFDSQIFYQEAEAAFDEDYAEALGFPKKSVKFIDNVETVEDLFDNMADITRAGMKQKVKEPILYVTDSLDAITDRAEQAKANKDGIGKSAEGKGDYGAAKAKQMSKLFRLLTKDLKKTKVCWMVISQIRDKIGVSFGETKERAGGHALDFYAAQVLWLAQLAKVKKTIDKIEKVIGINILALCKKNKISLPYRDCAFPLIFAYGVDDATSCLRWLSDITDGLDHFDIAKDDVTSMGEQLRAGEYPDVAEAIQRHTVKRWWEIEAKFLPKKRKYA